jgi:hypothetical protein
VGDGTEYHKASAVGAICHGGAAAYATKKVALNLNTPRGGTTPNGSCRGDIKGEFGTTLAPTIYGGWLVAGAGDISIGAYRICRIIYIMENTYGCPTLQASLFCWSRIGTGPRKISARDALYGDDVISYPTPMCAQQ